MRNAILPDTSLCAIVRDEKMNPAGGVELWLRCTIPHVKEAVVVDTGSIDGTREILENLKFKYPNLRVYDTEFEGFAHARNLSLSQIRTKRALVLDADELLTAEDFIKLREFMKESPCQAYDFNFEFIYNDGQKLKKTLDVMNPRLFRIGKTLLFSALKDRRDEDLLGEIRKEIYAPVLIKHFLASEDAEKKKHANWYNNGAYLEKNPIEVAKIDGWKDFNPHRERYQEIK